MTNVQLTPEQINEFIANSIMESQIGKLVQDSVNRVMRDLSTSYNNPFDTAIKSHVSRLIQEELINGYKPQILESVRKALETQVTDDLVSRMIKATFDKI